MRVLSPASPSDRRGTGRRGPSARRFPQRGNRLGFRLAASAASRRRSMPARLHTASLPSPPGALAVKQAILIDSLGLPYGHPAKSGSDCRPRRVIPKARIAEGGPPAKQGGNRRDWFPSGPGDALRKAGHHAGETGVPPALSHLAIFPQAAGAGRRQDPLPPEPRWTWAGETSKRTSTAQIRYWERS